MLAPVNFAVHLVPAFTDFILVTMITDNIYVNTRKIIFGH